jgi:hypothetical protein
MSRLGSGHRWLLGSIWTYQNEPDDGFGNLAYGPPKQRVVDQQRLAWYVQYYASELERQQAAQERRLGPTELTLRCASKHCNVMVAWERISSEEPETPHSRRRWVTDEQL